MPRPDGRAPEQRAGSARPRPGSRRHQSVSPGPASVSWTSKQLWEGRSSQLSTETSFRADRAFGLVEARAGPGVLGFRKECVWRACVCVLSTQDVHAHVRARVHVSARTLGGPASMSRCVCTREFVRATCVCVLPVCMCTRERAWVVCACVLPVCVSECPGSSCMGSCDPHFMREWPPGPPWRLVLPRQPGILWPRLGTAPWIFGSAL